jgi:hypothetical protein
VLMNLLKSLPMLLAAISSSSTMLSGRNLIVKEITSHLDCEGTHCHDCRALQDTLDLALTSVQLIG